MGRVRISTIAGFSILLILGGCQSAEKGARTEGAKPEAMAGIAVAELRPTAGNQASGRATFTRTGDGVEIVVEMQGLAPGRHGIHVHANGDCSAPDASSAGDHFAPDGAPHGGPDSPAGQRHAGDFGNIEAGPDGKASYRRVDRIIRLEGSSSIVGKAILIHAGEDDLTSQPAGGSGPRIACGVIEKR